MKAYVEFEIEEGAYEISCPDAQCEHGAILSIKEITSLVSPELMEKHHKFRLNRGVYINMYVLINKFNNFFCDIQMYLWTKHVPGVHVQVVKQYVQ